MTQLIYDYDIKFGPEPGESQKCSSKNSLDWAWPITFRKISILLNRLIILCIQSQILNKDPGLFIHGFAKGAICNLYLIYQYCTCGAPVIEKG